MKYETQRPYTASFVIVRNANKIAFLLRQNTPWMNDHYGLPSGKCEEGDSFAYTAIKEVEEEIGIKIQPNDLTHRLTMHRNEPDEDMVWVDAYFEATDWSGEPYNAEPHVHAELTWFDPKDLPGNIIPSVKAGIEAIEAGKTYVELGWDS